MKKISTRIVVSLLSSVLLWLFLAVCCPAEFLAISALCAFLSTAIFICLSAVGITRLKFPNISFHAVFTIADIILTIGVALYAIYDMNFDKSGFMPGLLGYVLLLLAIPPLVLLLAVNLIIWLIKRKRK